MVKRAISMQGKECRRLSRGDRRPKFMPSSQWLGSEPKGTEMDGRASLSIAADTQDIDMMAARSAGIWIGLSLDDEALASIRRDGLDPAALRLSGLHPFEFEPGPDGGLNVIAHANDNEAAEALLDLFRVFFLRRLLAARPVDTVPAE